MAGAESIEERNEGGNVIDPQLNLWPEDEYNTELVANVHPPEWRNPTPDGRYNLVVLGGGTAGLVAAAGAAGMGARVALIERHLLGGDCLNVGCVPSKAIIRSAHAAHDIRTAGRFGIRAGGEVEIDFEAVMERMRRIRTGISPHDSAKRFSEQYGIDVYFGAVRFTGQDTVEVEGTTLRFAKAVIATGARAAVPPIPGLAEAGFLTNHNVFNLTEQPRRLAVSRHPGNDHRTSGPVSATRGPGRGRDPESFNRARRCRRTAVHLVATGGEGGR